MKNVTLVEPYGYCEGVKRALAVAHKAREENPEKNIYVLGDLVHSHYVREELFSIGIKTLISDDQKSYKSIIQSFKADQDIAIYSAHGASEMFKRVCNKRKLKVYDATCPIVKANYEKVKEEIKNKHQVIWVGDEFHEEAIVALSMGKKVQPYFACDMNNYLNIRDKSPYVACQSTLAQSEIDGFYKTIKEKKPDARFSREVCPVARTRQENVINLPSDTDCIVVVGDLTSSNTKRLAVVAKESHPEAEVIKVVSLEDLKLSMLEDHQNIAVTSGAATPPNVVESIYEAIKALD
ncbi:MAG: 4-hydroxy-3-methylbut-2-enyl diphosphate reductase [Coprobacillus sp.]|nr:4-hydroxy-3-methylbut-2-enyl diphosphate reductase [Coprobacillus sp.]